MPGATRHPHRGKTNIALFGLVAALVLLALAAPGARAIVPIDLQSDFSQRWNGGSLDDESGTTAVNAGDVNGDGTPDVVMGSASGAGEAYVLYGDATAARDTTDLRTGLTPARGYVMDGLDPTVFTNAGLSVDNAGDVNGDGISDQLIGAPGLTCGAPNAVYVVFGQRGPAPHVNLASIGTPGNGQGYLIRGDASTCQAGGAVANIGDINNDGTPDALIGGYLAQTPAGQAGAAWVVYGQRDSVTTIDLASLQPSQGYEIQGANAEDRAGDSVANAGDVNRDGITDFLIGAPDATLMGSPQSGVAYLVFGRRSSATPIELADLQPAEGYSMGLPGAGIGEAVAGAGDVNSDGTPDALLGAPAAIVGSEVPGAALLMFGLPHSSATPIDLSNIGGPGNTQGTLLAGAADGDLAGDAVGSAGDVNGDGILDQLIGAPGTGSGNGTAFVVFGRDPMPERIDLSLVGSSAADPTGYLMTTGHFSAVGAAVANAGDVNEDGLADPLITGPFNTVTVIDEGSTWTVFSSLALPVPSTGPASSISASSATLNGTVAHGAPTCQASPARFQFEYGTTTAYGAVTPVRPAPVGAGAGRTPVSAPVTAVAPDTTLHYRLRATCGGAQAFGRDRTFTTAKAPPPPPPPPPPSWNATATIASSKARVGPRRYAAVRIRCRTQGVRRCNGILRLRRQLSNVNPAAPRHAGFSIPGGTAKTVRVLVSRRARRLAARRRGLRVRAIARTTQQGGGLRETGRRAVTLRARGDRLAPG
jgi:FG-GAP repeat